MYDEYVNSFIYSRQQLSLFLDLIRSIDRKEGITMEKLSDMINECEKCIDCLEFNDKVTLNPSKIIYGDYEKATIKIKGNSFGPFYPEDYFKENNFRVLWLLKESYIMKDSWYFSCDRGNHKQAEDYVGYFEEYDKFDNTTHDNILKLMCSFLKSAKKIKEGASGEEVLKHICILEVNHFPGLAFNSFESDDKLLNLWIDYNRSLLSTKNGRG